MPRNGNSLKRPRLAHIRQRVRGAQFTDGGGAAGTFQLSEQIPVGAEVLATQVRVISAFSGDTTCTLKVGDGSDDDRYNTGTPSIVAAAAAGVAMGVPSGTRYHATAVAPTLTATGGSDWGLVANGELEITIAFIDFGIEPE